MDKSLYVTVAKSVKAALPHIHLHAFSPEEIIYGAKKNKISVMEMIQQLKAAGVDIKIVTKYRAACMALACPA